MKQASCAISFLLVCLFCSFSFAQSNSTVQQRDLKNFSAISLSIPADLILKKGDFSFSMDAPSELAEKIRTEVKNGELVIRFENDWKNNIKESIRIEVSMPSLTALEVNGSGKITSSSSFDGERIKMEINGSGKINPGDIAYKTVSIVINGSGHIVDLKGRGSDVKLQINGSGEINAEGFSGEKVDCNVTGSGNISVGVSEALDAEVTGSGDIRYAGTPPKKNVNITGSGSVSSMK